LKKKKLIFILSSNYSGSHFLSLLLGSNTKAEHLGELKNLYKGQSEARCYKCNNLNSCDLFSGVDRMPKKDLYEELFLRVNEEVEVLIDASKKPKWFKDFVGDVRYDVRLIHLIRDPRALARRWLMRFEEKNIGLRERIKQWRKRPYKLFLFIFCDLLTICIYKWVSQNMEIASFVRKSGLPSKVITYRELALETDSILGDICKWVDIEYEPQQKRYWEFSHHGTQKHEYEWVREQGGAQIFDQRWKSYLNKEQIERVENGRVIKDLLGELSLNICTEGLESVQKNGAARQERGKK